MVKGATFIWASVAQSLGKGGGPDKSVDETPKDTMNRTLNRSGL